MEQRLYCDCCELLSINGVACRERGCPNVGARWDRDGELWVRQRECFECGCTVDHGDPCCRELSEDFFDELCAR